MSYSEKINYLTNDLKSIEEYELKLFSEEQYLKFKDFVKQIVSNSIAIKLSECESLSIELGCDFLQPFFDEERKLKNTNEVNRLDISQKILAYFKTRALDRLGIKNIVYGNYYTSEDFDRCKVNLDLFHQIYDAIKEKIKDVDDYNLLDIFFNGYQLKAICKLSGSPYITITSILSRGCNFATTSFYFGQKYGWEITIDDNIEIRKFGSYNTEYSGKSIKNSLDTIFNYYRIDISDEEKIKKEFSKVWGSNYHVNGLNYNVIENSYSIDSSTEISVLNNILPKSASAFGDYYKYTSLSTFIATIQSSKMRINSLETMNDPTELSYSDEFCSNMQNYGERNKGGYCFATSFSTRGDNLNMWRLYGDDGRGVCMKFNPIRWFYDESNPITMFEYFKIISYIGCSCLNNWEIVDNMKKMLRTLKNSNINFKFSNILKYNAFIKSEEYKEEKEVRLLINGSKPDGCFINDLGLITPYIEKALLKGDNVDSALNDYFPLKLVGVILGPKVPHADTNKTQLDKMLKAFGYEEVEVSKSKQVCYR